jgi:hypothetical protein
VSVESENRGGERCRNCQAHALPTASASALPTALPSGVDSASFSKQTYVPGKLGRICAKLARLLYKHQMRDRGNSRVGWVWIVSRWHDKTEGV